MDNRDHSSFISLRNAIRWVLREIGSGFARLRTHEHLFPLLVAIIIGLFCGGAAVVFRLLIAGFKDLFWGSPWIAVDLLRDQPAWRIVLVPAAGGLLVGLFAHIFSRESSGHGVPEVMLAVARLNGIIRARVALTKTLTAAVTLASGGSAGPEGPIIQIGSAIGSFTGQLLKASRRRLRTFIGCGAAGGIAATFNAPIAGALFAVEVILGEFGVSQFSPIVISSVLATLVARHYFGAGPVFAVPAYRLASSLELIPYALLGALCGLVSFAFIRALGASEDYFDKQSKAPAWLRPAMGGLLVGLIGLFLPHIFSDGHHVIDLALLNRLAWWLLPVLLVMKIVATSLTLGSGGSGGVFSPSLFMGAMTGALVGQLSGALMHHATTLELGGYALAGMGGLVAGTTHAPITAIVIIFEITGSYNLILPLMIVCILSSVVARKLCPHTIYTVKLAARGIDLFEGRSLDLLQHCRVDQCMGHDFETLPADTLESEALNHILQSKYAHLYLVADGQLRGVLPLSEARRLFLKRDRPNPSARAGDLNRIDSPFCIPSESLSVALPRFIRSGLPELPVVTDADSKELIGVLRYADVIRAYQDEILKADTVGSLATHVAATQSSKKVRVMEDFFLAEWDPPASFWNKTLKTLRLPAMYGVHVVLVKSREDKDRSLALPVMPGPDYIIAENDALIIYGREEDIDRALTL